MRHAGLIATLLTATMVSLWAQKVTIAPNQNHLFLSSDKPSTLQLALDQAASSGLHVVFGSNQGVFLTRVSTGAPGGYRPIADNRVDEFERALNAGGEQGFRVVPETLTRSGNNTLTVMRRAPGGATPYRYRVLASDDAFEKNLSDLASKGFSLVGVFTQQSGMAASLGRPGRLHAVLESSGSGTAANTPVPAGGPFRVVSAVRTSAMEKEINQAAADGYRVKGGSFMNVLVEKVDAPPAKYTYRVIGASRGTTLQDEIQQAGREGYRVVPSAIMGNPGSKSETVVLMEHAAANSRSYEYHFVIPSADSMGPELDGLLANGFAPVGLFMHVTYVILFEKGI